jgi:hypothetical protein
VGTAFDEYSHSADFRRGRAKAGWHNISNLGVFVWRLKSFAVVQATPVPCATTGLYAFDPTGRKLPLFARSARSKEAAYGDHWVSSEEWQMPGPLRKSLYERERANLYPGSLELFRRAGSFYDSVDPAQVTVFPELGTFQVAAALQNETLLVSYRYGFSSLIGAGPYDRRIVKSPPASGPATIVSGGGALPALPTSGTTTIEDSQTYDSPAAVAAIQDLTLRAGNEQRPLIRLDRWTPWRLTGSSSSSGLTMDGAFISGGDVVIAGDLDTITLTCCTLDPGSSGGSQNPPAILADSVQGQPLWPTRLWVEGNVRMLEIERCVVGPIRTRSGGDIETIQIRDSIVQGIRTEGFGDFIELKDPDRLVRRLQAQTDPLSSYLWSQLTQSQQAISSYLSGGANHPTLGQVAPLVAADLNALIKAGSSIYSESRFARVRLEPAARALAQAPSSGPSLVRLNRVLLESAYPTELADLAIAATTGTTVLERCTVLGPAALHRLEASECILDDRVVVEDVQHGCVRFSAWATGSVLPRRYESVEVAASAPLFASDDFGQPGYAQLLGNADRHIIQPSEGASIREGGPAGSEMGAFAKEINAIRERSLLIKYQEFMPLGLSPVVVNVT